MTKGRVWWVSVLIKIDFTQAVLTWGLCYQSIQDHMDFPQTLCTSCNDSSPWIDQSHNFWSTFFMFFSSIIDGLWLTFCICHLLSLQFSLTVIFNKPLMNEWLICFDYIQFESLLKNALEDSTWDSSHIRLNREKVLLITQLCMNINLHATNDQCSSIKEQLLYQIVCNTNLSVEVGFVSCTMYTLTCFDSFSTNSLSAVFYRPFPIFKHFIQTLIISF